MLGQTQLQIDRAIFTTVWVLMSAKTRSEFVNSRINENIEWHAILLYELELCRVLQMVSFSLQAFRWLVCNCKLQWWHLNPFTNSAWPRVTIWRDDFHWSIHCWMVQERPTKCLECSWCHRIVNGLSGRLCDVQHYLGDSMNWIRINCEVWILALFIVKGGILSRPQFSHRQPGSSA